MEFLVSLALAQDEGDGNGKKRTLKSGIHTMAAVAAVDGGARQDRHESKGLKDGMMEGLVGSVPLQQG